MGLRSDNHQDNCLRAVFRRTNCCRWIINRGAVKAFSHRRDKVDYSSEHIQNCELSVNSFHGLSWKKEAPTWNPPLLFPFLPSLYYPPFHVPSISSFHFPPFLLPSFPHLRFSPSPFSLFPGIPRLLNPARDLTERYKLSQRVRPPNGFWSIFR